MYYPPVGTGGYTAKLIGLVWGLIHLALSLLLSNY